MPMNYMYYYDYTCSMGKEKEKKNGRKIDHAENFLTILHVLLLPFVGDGSVYMKGRERERKERGR